MNPTKWLSCNKLFARVVKPFLCLPPVALGLFVGLLWLSGCRGPSTRCRYSYADRERIDSLVRAVHDADSLNVLIGECARRGDVLGCEAAYREQGKLYRNQSRYEDAIDAHHRMFFLADSLRDTVGLVEALNNLGTDYRRMDILELACDCHSKALLLANTFSDHASNKARKNHVVSLNGLGNVYLAIGNDILADSLFRQALEGERQLGSGLGMAINYANIGTVFERREMTDSAWHYYKLSMQLNDEADNDLGVAICHNHYGHLYERAGNMKKALAEYQHSYQLMGDMCDRWQMLESLIAMARIFHATGKDGEALRLLSEGDTIARAIRSWSHLADICALYSAIDEQRGDMRQALYHYRQSEQYQDSVISIRKMNEIQNIRLAVERQRKAQELVLVEENLRLEQRGKRQLVWIVVMGGLFALSVIAWMVYVARNNRRRACRQRREFEERELMLQGIIRELRQQAHSGQPMSPGHLPDDGQPTADAPSGSAPAASAPAAPEADGTGCGCHLTYADQAFLDQFIEVVYSQMKKGMIEVEKVASELCMSSSQLRRKVTELTGEPPVSYINRIKMSYAKRLFDTHPELLIGEVATRCGYDDSANFTRSFKQIFGISPSRYKRRSVSN